MNKFFKETGFTLVETLVAISILVVTISGAMLAAQSGISSDIFSKDQITAFYLAQEAVEQIRNIRDENGLSATRPWLAGIAQDSTDPCYFGKICIVDPFNPTSKLITCDSVRGCDPLLQDPQNGYYGYQNGWTPTIFTRTIQLSHIDTNEASIVVTINWHKGAVSRQFKVHENIFNWQE